MRVALPEWYRELTEPSLNGARPAWYRDGESALEALKGADAFWHELWGPGQPKLADLIAAGAGVRWLHTSSAGVEWIDADLLGARKIRLTNGAGLHAPPIAEHVVMCMLIAQRGLLPLLRAQAERRWDRHGGRQELAGAKVLILGYGLIGQTIGRKAKALGAEVTGVRRRDRANWRDLLPDSDFLVVAAPLTAATRGIVGARELKALKPGAWLINIARGPLVVEQALLDALDTGRLGGAALDVFDLEPLPAEHPLWTRPNVVLTPHVSALTDRMRGRAAGLFLDNLERFRRGKRLRNLVNLEAGY